MVAAATDTGAGPSTPVRTMALLSSLFFMWGFITVINNTLLPHLRSVFELSYTKTTLIESTWFVGYLVASLPAAWLIARIGYQRAMVIALGIMTVGSLGMVLAASIPSYGVTLVALFTVSCGIALLQVAANPYVAVIGPAETASARLNLVQAFNSLGTTVAPLFGGLLILGRSSSGTAQGEVAADHVAPEKVRPGQRPVRLVVDRVSADAARRAEPEAMITAEQEAETGDLGLRPAKRRVRP